jgi:hypothetical protein
MIFAWRSIVGGNLPDSNVRLRLIWKVPCNAVIGFSATNFLPRGGSVTCARASTDVEPVVEGLPGRTDVASEVPLSEHEVEVSLRRAHPAVNRFADVLAFPSFRIAADVMRTIQICGPGRMI